MNRKSKLIKEIAMDLDDFRIRYEGYLLKHNKTLKGTDIFVCRITITELRHLVSLIDIAQGNHDNLLR